MPANPKYLSNPWPRVGKVSAAILGGLLATIAIHISIGTLLEDNTPLLMTAVWSSWLVWVLLMLLAFASKRAWKVWVLYIVIIVVGGVIIYLNK